MLTHCPACQTVFRVRPEQLRAHRGQVRCGACLQPFNALEHLLDEAPAAPEIPPAAAAPGAEQVAFEPPLPSDAADRFFVLEDKTENSYSAQLDFELPDALVPPREPRAPEARIEPTILDHDAAAPTLDTEPIRPAADEATPEPPTAGAGETLGAHPVEEPPTERPERIEPAAPPVAETPPPAPPAGAPGGLAPPLEQPADEEEVDQSHLDATYGPAAPSPGRRALLAAAVGLLTGILAVQATYLFRADIAREWPALRPALVAACAVINCTVPLPQVAGLISVAASDLQAEPGKVGRFVLHATIRNRAPHPQAYPHLELTLTDAQDRPLVRRVLAAQEWSPAADLEQGFAAGRDIAVTLPFEARGIDAAGYRIYVFYP